MILPLDRLVDLQVYQSMDIFDKEVWNIYMCCVWRTILKLWLVQNFTFITSVSACMIVKTTSYLLTTRNLICLLLILSIYLSVCQSLCSLIQMYFNMLWASKENYTRGVLVKEWLHFYLPIKFMWIFFP